MVKTDFQETVRTNLEAPDIHGTSNGGIVPTAGADLAGVGVSAPTGLADGEEPRSRHFTATRNACKLCTPLGACLAFRGVEGCIPLLHGSQGCATYIRRYLISHFREPIDIASSNFHEESAIFGGSRTFTQAALNVTRQYHPQLIGAATTCLAETIGEDLPRLVRDLASAQGEAVAPLVPVSTASYRGTHIDGFHAAVRELVSQLAEHGVSASDRPNTAPIALFPGMVSPADLRHLKEIFADFGLPLTLLPDYSDTMDGVSWSQYEKLQSGGTPLAEIRALGSARASIELGRMLEGVPSAGTGLRDRLGVMRHGLGLPVGLTETDAFFATLEQLSDRPTPPKYQGERGRLVDSLIDAHKYVFEKRAIVYGEEDLVIGLTALLGEVGITPVLCATGARSKQFEPCLRAAAPELAEETRIQGGLDFAAIAEMAPSLRPDLLIGNSKGYSIARALGVPLIRVGFPIHDRLGGQRILHLGYRGAQALFDRIVNALLDTQQDQSAVGYSYL